MTDFYKCIRDFPDYLTVLSDAVFERVLGFCFCLFLFK